MRKLSYVTLILIGFIGLKLNAQTLTAQYDSTVTKSNNYQNYKVINQNKINIFWKNVQDSLKKQHQMLSNTQNALTKRNQEYQTLEKELAETRKELNLSQNNVDHISLLGLIAIDKSSYKMVMWGFVIILILLNTFLFLRMKSARKEALYRVKLFEEQSEEFKSYKVNANEKEKKLARELQDERNKLQEINAN